MYEKAFQQLTQCLEQLNKGVRFELPDSSAFPAEMRSFVEQFRLVCKNLWGLLDFAANISKGSLGIDAPDRTNYMAGTLKDLHSKMRHLSWQAKQISKGDFSQSIDFMGEFSDSFNDMIARIAEREEQLKEQLSKVEEDRRSIQVSYNLLNELLENIPEVVVVSRRSLILFRNKSARALEAQLNANQSLDGDNIVKHIKELNVSITKFHEFFDPTLKRWFLIDLTPILWTDEKPANVFMITDITTHKRNEKRLQKAAESDALTSVGNRKYGIRLLTEALNKKTSFPLCICFIDLDGLKTINDTYGHAAGDTYLKTFTATVKKLMSPNDILSRVGGDEFFLMMKKTSKKQALNKIRRIEESFRSIRRPNTFYSYQFSYGLLEVEPNTGESAHELIQRSDILMYRNKQEKRKRI